MSDSRVPGPAQSHGANNHDPGTMCRNRTHPPGPGGLHPPSPAAGEPGSQASTYSYALSGNPGALGNMFLTEAQTRLPGTWYDHTDTVNQFRQSEAQLGVSGFGNAEFRQIAGRILANLARPPHIDVELHFTRSGVEEIIQVRGCRRTRSYRFDLKEVEKKKLPEGVDNLQPLYDAINQLIALVREVR